jgi:hypothetical protein
VPTVVHFHAGQSNVPVAISAFPDDERELPEPVEIVLLPGAGYFVDPAGQAANLVIQDSGPVITVEAIEPLAVVQDGSPGAFLLRRQGMLSESLTVLFDLAGTATMNVDYRRVNRFVTFGNGATTVLVPITPTLSATITGGAETVDLRITPDAGYSIGAASNAQVRLVSAYLTFAQWKSTHFPTNTTPLAQFANLDYDGDGILNRFEYALALDPKTSSAHAPGLPSLVVMSNRLGIRFTRPVAAVDVAYLIEVSTNLVNWVPADDAFDPLPSTLKAGGIEEVGFLDRLPVTTFPRRFVRVNPVLQ